VAQIQFVARLHTDDANTLLGLQLPELRCGITL